MKKLFAFILVFVLCLSLASCGASKYAKYDELISYIEKGYHDSALLELEKLMSSSEGNGDDDDNESKVTAVEITMENWKDYFEIVEEISVTKNAFGEVEDAYKSFYIVLKEKYTIASGSQQYQTSVAVEYDYVIEWRYVEIDKVNGTLSVGELVPDRNIEDKSGSMVTVSNVKTSLTPSRSYTETTQGVPASFKVARIQGTLYIAG